MSISVLTSVLNGAPFSSSAAIVFCPTPWPGTLIGLLVGDEIRGGEEAVLEIVDAEAGRFRVGDRAEMAGDLDAAAMRFVDRGGELAARDLHVGLERRRAFVGPVLHLPARVLGPLQRAHLDERVRAVQVRRGRVDRRARASGPASTSRIMFRSMKPFTLPPVLIVVTPPER